MYQSWVPVSFLLRKLQQKSVCILDSCDASAFLSECQQLFTGPKGEWQSGSLIFLTFQTSFSPSLILYRKPLTHSDIRSRINWLVHYASRRSRMSETVKLTVCVCVFQLQRLQCDENYRFPGL